MYISVFLKFFIKFQIKYYATMYLAYVKGLNQDFDFPIIDSSSVGAPFRVVDNLRRKITSTY